MHVISMEGMQSTPSNDIKRVQQMDKWVKLVFLDCMVCLTRVIQYDHLLLIIPKETHWCKLYRILVPLILLSWKNG